MQLLSTLSFALAASAAAFNAPMVARPAAPAVRRAQEAVLRSRPFSETLERILGGLLQRLSTEALDIPLMESREAKKVGMVVVTGDRGLCGGYNAQMIKKAE